MLACVRTYYMSRDPFSHTSDSPYTASSLTSVRQVSDAQRFPLPSGLSPRLCEGEDGFATLCEILAIRSSKQKQVIVNAPPVKRFLKANGHVPPRHTKTAERLRLGLLALYSDPETRRNIWRSYVQHGLDGKNPTDVPIPSLEHAAFTRYDAALLTAVPDADRLADCAALYERDRSRENWRVPALAVLPRLQADINDWESLASERRTAVLDAALAAATVLDDSRLLRWAARQADDIAHQFAFATAEDPPRKTDDKSNTKVDDVLTRLRVATNELEAATANLASQPTAELFDSIASLATSIASFREPVLDHVSMDAVDSLIEGFASFLDEKSGAAPWLQDRTQEVIAAWRAAYPATAKSRTNEEHLRTDLDRAAENVDRRLADWADARSKVAHAKAALDGHETGSVNQRFPFHCRHRDTQHTFRRPAVKARAGTRSYAEGRRRLETPTSGAKGYRAGPRWRDRWAGMPDCRVGGSDG